MLVTTPLGHARRWIWRIGQRGQFASVPLAGGCTATDIVMGKDGKRDERKARRARKAEKQMNRRLHEKEAGQRKQSKRRKHSTASSAVLEISFRSQGVLCGFVPFAQLPADQILSAPVQLDTSTIYHAMALDICGTKSLIHCLVPQLTERTGAQIIGAPCRGRQRRGCVMFLSEELTLSGAHKDISPGLLYVVEGTRSIWLAAPEEAIAHEWKRDSSNSASEAESVWLHRQHDPHQSGSRYGWRGAGDGGPIVLRAGDAVFIPPAWWHAIMGAPGGVALALEVGSMASQPVVYRHVGPTRAPVHVWNNPSRIRQRATTPMVVP